MADFLQIDHCLQLRQISQRQCRPYQAVGLYRLLHRETPMPKVQYQELNRRARLRSSPILLALDLLHHGPLNSQSQCRPLHPAKSEPRAQYHLYQRCHQRPFQSSDRHRPHHLLQHLLRVKPHNPNLLQKKSQKKGGSLSMKATTTPT